MKKKGVVHVHIRDQRNTRTGRGISWRRLWGSRPPGFTEGAPKKGKGKKGEKKKGKKGTREEKLQGVKLTGVGEVGEGDILKLCSCAAKLMRATSWIRP